MGLLRTDAAGTRARCLLVGVVGLLAAGCTGAEAPSAPAPSAPASSTPASSTSLPAGDVYPVVSVADGDTITVSVDGVDERVRLIGIDSPELHRPVECFGLQAADHATELLAGAAVRLVADPTQDDRDRYGRLLRYVELADGTDVNAGLIRDGYAFEYTYDAPYERRALFRRQEAEASSAQVGLWSPATCDGRGAAATGQPASTAPAVTTPIDSVPPDGCAIKGNINRRGERIYHLPGDSSYDETVISPSKGERYFCAVDEAVGAGWRAAER
ncbi:thermonuclease family protein [Nakamurella sp. GG22]